MTENLSTRTGRALTWRFATLVGSKSIALARTLVLARLLVPDDFGLMAIALVTIHTTARITDLGMTPALVQHRDRNDGLLDTAWTLGVVRSLLLAAVLVLAAPWIAGIFGDPRATWILRWTALLPILQALSSIAITDLIRDLEFARLAALTLTTLMTEAIVSISLAPTYGVGALVVGAIAGPAIALPLSYLLAPHFPRPRFSRRDATLLIRFGRWILLSGILATIASLVMQITISRLLGAASLGFYYLAVRLTDIPVQISGKVVDEVAFPMFARLQEDAIRTGRAFRSMIKGLIAVVAPMSIALVVFADRIVSDLLGPTWESSAPLIRILAIASLVGLYGDACAPLFKGQGKPRYATLLELTQVVVLISLILPLTDRYGLVGAATSWLPATLAAQFAAAILIRRMLPGSAASRPGSTAMLLFISGLAALGWFPVIGLVEPPFGILAALGGFALTIPTLYWLLDRHSKLDLIEDGILLFPAMKSILERLPGSRTNPSSGAKT